MWPRTCGRLRDRRGGAAALRRGACRRRDRQIGHRQRCAPGGRRPRRSTATPMSTALADDAPSPSPSISAAPSPTSPCTTRRAARSGAPRRPACRPIPRQAFLTGMRLALEEAGRAAPALGRVLHGTTVATNMILEGKGARTALVTTAGFRHVLAIGRQDIPRRANYSRLGEAAAARAGLARARGQGAHRRRRRGASSRSTRRACEAAADACRKLRVEAVAVCLLHSFANPAHERRVAEILRARPARRRGDRVVRRAAGGARIRALAGDGAERRW